MRTNRERCVAIDPARNELIVKARLLALHVALMPQLPWLISHSSDLHAVERLKQEAAYRTDTMLEAATGDALVANGDVLIRA